jgi:hypothetical protein
VEQAEADPVVAVVFEDLEAGLGLAGVFEDDALGFGVREEGNVGADGIVVGGARDGEQCDYRERRQNIAELHFRIAPHL